MFLIQALFLFQATFLTIRRGGQKARVVRIADIAHEGAALLTKDKMTWVRLLTAFNLQPLECTYL